jgi:hypothetical protein
METRAPGYSLELVWIRSRYDSSSYYTSVGNDFNVKLHCSSCLLSSDDQIDAHSLTQTHVHAPTMQIRFLLDYCNDDHCYSTYVRILARDRIMRFILICCGYLCIHSSVTLRLLGCTLHVRLHSFQLNWRYRVSTAVFCSICVHWNSLERIIDNPRRR